MDAGTVISILSSNDALKREQDLAPGNAFAQGLLGGMSNSINQSDKEKELSDKAMVEGAMNLFTSGKYNVYKNVADPNTGQLTKVSATPSEVLQGLQPRPLR